VLCLKLLHQPVTIACGHSFCRPCLVRALDHIKACPVWEKPRPRGVVEGRRTWPSRPGLLLQGERRLHQLPLVQGARLQEILFLPRTQVLLQEEVLLLSAAGRGGAREGEGGALGEPRDAGARMDWRTSLLVCWAWGGGLGSEHEGAPRPHGGLSSRACSTTCDACQWVRTGTAKSRRSTFFHFALAAPPSRA